MEEAESWLPERRESCQGSLTSGPFLQLGTQLNIERSCLKSAWLKWSKMAPTGSELQLYPYCRNAGCQLSVPAAFLSPFYFPVEGWMRCLSAAHDTFEYNPLPADPSNSDLWSGKNTSSLLTWGFVPQSFLLMNIQLEKKFWGKLKIWYFQWTWYRYVWWH